MNTRADVGSKTLDRATRRGVWIGTFVLVLLTLITPYDRASWYEIFALSAAVGVAAFVAYHLGLGTDLRIPSHAFALDTLEVDSGHSQSEFQIG